jgi:hypothetical protein
MVHWNLLVSYFVIFIVSDLPSAIYGGSLVQFEGLPTYIGGYQADFAFFNTAVYQYDWNEDEWFERNELQIEQMRRFSATFEVPRDIFGLC